MSTLAPIPKPGQDCWFYANDQLKKDTEYKAKIQRVFTYKASETIDIPRYDDFYEEMLETPIADIWLEEVVNLFWLLAETTDYIVEFIVPELTNFTVFAARDVDGGWHSFETYTPKQWGILDVTGEIHKELYNIDDRTNDLPPGPEYY